MGQAALPTSIRSRISIVALALVAALLLIPVGASADTATASATKQVAKESRNATLGKTVLTTKAGHTLYSLSAEKHGKFICTGSCLSLWTPLTVPAGVTPTGPVKFKTVKRPDGRTQVTYKGLPLYSFREDTKPGQANGEGIRDVGTWHAAAVPSSQSAEPQPEPAPNPNPYPPYPY